MEKGVLWQNAIAIALRSIRKSLSERKKQRKSWPVGKARKIML